MHVHHKQTSRQSTYRSSNHHTCLSEEGFVVVVVAVAWNYAKQLHPTTRSICNFLLSYSLSITIVIIATIFFFSSKKTSMRRRHRFQNPISKFQAIRRRFHVYTERNRAKLCNSLNYHAALHCFVRQSFAF